MKEEDRYQLAVDTGTTEYYHDQLRRAARTQEDEVPILSLKQVAKWLDISTKTVKRLVEREELKGFKVGRAWKFEREDVQAYLQHQRELAVTSRRESAP